MNLHAIKLVALLSPSQLKLHWGKLLIAIIGISVGTAGYTAIRLANRSAFNSLVKSSNALTSEADLIISSATGEINEDLVPKLWGLNGISRVAPLLIQYVSTESSSGKRIIQVVGSDLIQNGFNLGDFKLDELFQKTPAALSKIPDEQIEVVIEGQKKSIKLLHATSTKNSILDSFGGQTILLDISTFQELFSRVGKVNKIAVKFEPGTKEVEQSVSSILTPGLSTAANEIPELEHLTGAFRLNLNFLSFLSLLVSSLLIFNAVSFITLQRRGELSILRLIGGSPSQIRLLILLESGILGFFSSLLGIFLGSYLSRSLVTQVSRSIGNLYHPTSAATSELSLDILLTSLLLGTVMSILGSLPPAINSGRVQFQESVEKKKFRVRNYLVCGTLLLLLTYLSTIVFADSSVAYLGFIPPGILTLSFFFFAPVISESGFKLSKKFERIAGVELSVARNFLEVSPRRVFSTVSAVGLALGLFLGVSSMVESFRASVDNWLGNILRADIYFSSQESISGASTTGLPASLIDALKSHAEVRRTDQISSRIVNVTGARIFIHGTDFKTIFKEKRLEFLSVNSELKDQKEISLVSESYLRRFRGSASVEIPTAQGIRKVPIAGIFRDYTSEQGVVYLPVELFSALFKDSTVQGASVYLQNGTSPQKFIESVRESQPELVYVARINKELKDEVLRVFDQTFLITYALEAVALIVSLFVIINTVLMLSVERSRDLALLSAIGASSKQRLKVFFYESTLLGITGGVSGVLQGFLLSLILVFFVNRFFFGWSITYKFNFLAPTLTLLLVGLLAGALGSLASKLHSPSVLALKYE